ncbi:MAG TPA: ShlB/FhaC/HecB family hemolysin secretion/activation protein [Caldimonas sp.]|nr:ShlB/FhaC/HecB family hemolysin secretion/activation protein [Caldimonas sp.]
MPHSNSTTSRSRRPALGGSLFLGLLIPLVALAQTPPQQPNAGSILQQVQPSLASPVPADRAAPDLRVPRAVAEPSSGGGAKVDVRGFRIAGLPEARADRLKPLLQKYTGPGKTLADLEDAAKDIEVALQRQGLFLAQAYVPEQSLADGIVTIQVLEGRIGAVKVEVEPGVRVAPEYLDRIVDVLRGHPVAERNLIERALFTLGDLRGIVVATTLSPGDKVGEADLTVKISPGPKTAATVDLDNGGSLFTGRYRANVGLDWFSPTGRGDVASLRGQVSDNLGSEFIRASWLTPINSLGTKVGIAASFLHYKLGSAIFEDLGAHGTAEDYALQLLHPLIRSRNDNLFVQFSTNYRRFDDKVDSLPLDTKKDVSPYATVAVVGDFRDTFAGGAISNYSLGVVGGRLKINDEDDIVVDQQNYKSAGSYAKLQLGASRLQHLPTKDYLYLALNGQLASKNLDSSEKFSMGGPYGVRGYPSPESPSDSGLIATWEYRKQIPIEALPGDVVFSIFGDYGVADLHHDPRTEADPTASAGGNIRRLVSHGIGVTYARRDGLTVKGYVAARGGLKAQSDDSRAQLYLLVSQQF